MKIYSIFFVLFLALSFLHAPPVQADAQHLQQNQKVLTLVAAARSQVGVTTLYDSRYVRIPYPNGDVPLVGGVCTDVIIRAYRKALGYDLQKTVHEDMEKSFSAYPTIWGMKKPDANIDHRRVPDLQAFFKRRGAQLPISDKAGDYLAGDIVTQMVGHKFAHIVMVSDKKSLDSQRPLVIHNIGDGVHEEDTLFKYPITGHYRYLP